MVNAVRNIAPVKTGKKSKISVILLSAGEAARMKSHGPRPLLKLTPDLNLITHQLQIINNSIPNNEVIMVCGCEADRVMNNTPLGIIKVVNERFEETNVVRSISLGLRAATTDKILLIYGDLLFNEDTFKNAKFEESSIFIDKFGLMNKDSVGCTLNESETVEHMLYDLPNKWAQIMFITGKELSIYKNIVWNKEKERMFGFEVINEAIEKRGVFRAQTPKNMKVVDIDSYKDLAHIKSIL